MSLAHRLLPTSDPEIRKMLKELRARQIKLGNDLCWFELAGCPFEIRLKVNENEPLCLPNAPRYLFHSGYINFS